MPEEPTVGEQMDAAAAEAGKELDKMPKGDVEKIGAWVKAHYMKAGHKRLSQLLLKKVAAEKAPAKGK